MIQRFTDLHAWQEAHKLVLLVYKITRSYPREEQFGLVNQSRRAVVSITSNIAEGFGRSTRKDKVNFYMMARTSLTELRNQIIIARDLMYIDTKTDEQFCVSAESVAKLISGLERSASDK
ncbi:MAG: four helix bundle protein [bacterium]|nr:four helix bundle protein [bacterium]